MNPLRVRASNYRTFRDLDLDLPAGCVAVTGENGAGKSSLVNVIDYALFGAESRSLADLLSDDPDETDMMIELEFEHAGERYRVRRSYSARGRGKTSVDFEQALIWAADDSGVDTWDPRTCESGKETDQLISDTIGLTRQTFRASAFLAQGDGAAFTDAPPAQRKQVLAEVLGLDVWTRLQERAKHDRRTAETELQRLDGEAAAARTLAAEKPDFEREHAATVTRRDQAAADLAAAEAALADLETRYRAAAETAKERGTLEAALAIARADLTDLQRADVAATEAVTAIRVAHDELETLPVPTATDTLTGREHDLVAKISLLERARADHDAAVLRIRAAEAERQSLLDRADTEERERVRLRDAAAELDQAPHDEARCDRCQQTLNGEARALAVESMGREADAHAGAAERLRGLADLIVVEEPPAAPQAVELVAHIDELATVRAELARAQAAAQQRARLEERIRQLQPAVDNRPGQAMIDSAAKACLELGERLDDLEPVDLDTIARDGTTARTRVTELRQEHQARAGIVERLAARLEQITAAEQQIAAIDTRARILRAEVDLCVQLEKAYGRDGIPALVIENSAIPSIETEADRILAALGGSTASCTVELRTQAARKTDQGLRDTLDVVIVGDQGERAYETFSGGERTRINLALRIALARLLAHRRGAESRLLAIDEPEFLDEQGTGALVEVLRGLQGDFDKLYIVSHVPSLRDSFDEVIAVVKDGDQSRIADIDAAVEAVAA